MITYDDIKPIPKHILKLIEKADNIAHPVPSGNTRFYSYLTRYRKELVRVTVAVRNKYKKWYCKQVAIHGIHTDKVFLQDIELVMGFYKVGWYRDGLSKTETWHDYDWGTNDAKFFRIYCPIVNLNYLKTLPEYKYSASDLYEYNDILKYLKFYEEYPQIELLVKGGLSNLATSKMIVKKCAKDKKFAKWLLQNKEEVKRCGYTSSLINAYKLNKSIREIYKFDSFKKAFDRPENFKQLKEMFTGKERIKFLNYLINQHADGSSYSDYLDACRYLGIDMNEDKNRYPHNFKKWHDIRIDQYHTQKALDDEKARKDLYKTFNKVANKYMSLQRKLKDNFIMIIAKSPDELILEGKTLHHCVGRMNYDQKFAREESLIFFVRDKNNPQTPLVTVEYSLINHKVLQCYAEYNRQPKQDILNFVNNIWLPYANRKIKKVA